MTDNTDQKRGERMRHLRESLGFREQQEFASAIGITKSRWSNVENGYPVSEDVATKLKRNFPGLTRDYIQDGDATGLSLVMLQTLGLAPRGPSSALS